MPFDPQIALEYARLLSIPRLVGSEGEASVRQAITDQLEGTGYDVEQQAFTMSTVPEVVLALQILLGQLSILGILVLGMSQRRSSDLLAWLIVGLLVSAAPINRLARQYAVALDPPGTLSTAQRHYFQLGSTFSTANIVANVPRSSADPKRPHMILVAHYDSKSQNLSLPIRIALFILLMLASAAFAILTLLGTTASAAQSAASILGALALAAGIPLLMLGTGNTSPGAIDNASGVGLVLHLAEILTARPEVMGKLNFTILITGAEELGTLGAQAYIARHREALLRQHEEQGLYILNFDGPGVDGNLCVVGQKRRDPQLRTASLMALIQNACEKAGIALRRTLLPGALLDHMPFARMGLDAVSLAVVGGASLTVHTKRDRPELLHQHGFMLGGEVAMRVIERLASEES